MIIIPEIETVLLQPPRTGSSSVKGAVLAKYPQAFMLYRHMEYDGIPAGYDRWRVVSHLRNPATRMESLFKYMQAPEVRDDTDPQWLASVKAATAGGFEKWFMEDTYVFANSSPTDAKTYRPRYQVMYSWPEQIKSQKLYAACADEIIFFENLEADARDILGVEIGHRGKTETKPLQWTRPMLARLRRWHKWDLEQYDPTAIYAATNGTEE